MRDYNEKAPSPKNDARACLCADGKTYSRKCCDGSFEAQGIGSITRNRFFLYTEDGFIIEQENNLKLYQ